MKRLIAVSSLIVMMFSQAFAVETPPQPPTQPIYTADGVKNMVVSLNREIAEANKWADLNQSYDVAFKVILGVLATASAIGSAFIAKQSADKPSPSWLPIGVTAITTIIVILTTFSTAQINFASRHAVFRKKADYLTSLQSRLQNVSPTPSPTNFEDDLTEVRAWGNYTSPDVQVPSQKSKK